MPRIHKYGETKTTRIMMATVRHVTAWAGRTKYQAAWFLLNGVYIFCIHSTYTLYSSICLLVVQSYTIQDQAFNPLTPGKYSFKWEFCFISVIFFRTYDPGIKQDLPVHVYADSTIYCHFCCTSSYFLITNSTVQAIHQPTKAVVGRCIGCMNMHSMSNIKSIVEGFPW